jgi:hypothetical protein
LHIRLYTHNCDRSDALSATKASLDVIVCAATYMHSMAMIAIAMETRNRHQPHMSRRLRYVHLATQNASKYSHHTCLIVSSGYLYFLIFVCFALFVLELF